LVSKQPVKDSKLLLHSTFSHRGWNALTQLNLGIEENESTLSLFFFLT
jgi:hypothetical protein